MLTLGAAKQIDQAVQLGAKSRDGVDLVVQDIFQLHHTLFEGTRDEGIGGVLRNEPIWVGPSGCLIEHASFVAPPEDHIMPLLQDLVDYLNCSDHLPVLKAAIMHAQFETIHPFVDGNGRTGRALFQFVLNADGVVQGTVPLSTTLSNDRSSYYHALNTTHLICDKRDNASRSAALSQWLLLFNRSCQESQWLTEQAVRNAELLLQRWQSQGKFRSNSAAAALLDVLPTMPVFDRALVSKRLGVTKRVAQHAIKSLEAAGIVSRTGGQRNRRFIVHDIVEVLQRSAPDGGVIAQPIDPVADTQPWRSHGIPCGFVGPRSQKPCLLPKGHKGNHRYK